MKKFIAILLSITFSSMICGSKVYKLKDIYNNIDKNLCYVQESGLRMEFLTSRSLENQLYVIKNVLELNEDIFNKENIKNNESYIFQESKKDNKIKIVMSKEKNEIRVIIEIINTVELMDMEKSKQLLEKLEDDTTKEERYFSYLKGKIKENKNSIENLKKSIGNNYIKDINSISINSGVTGIINLKNNETLNYSIVSYSNDTYLIIGSPVIFTTY